MRGLMNVAGPIIAGEHPRMEAFLMVAMIVLLLVFTDPILGARVLDKLPWLTPVFNWIHQHQNSTHK